MVDLREFLARSTDKEFDETTLAKVLSGLPPLSPSGPWIAGGALRRTLLRQELDSDFDFFFRNPDQLSIFTSELDRRGMEKVRETEHHVHYRGRVGDSAELIDIQCIRFAFYADAEAVIDSFDFTICQFAFDGTSLTSGPYSLWDLGRKRLAVHRVTYPVSSMRRVLKYATQGFKACNGCLATLLRATAENPSLNMEIAYVD
ncbi:hypothetical protein [Rhizobium leguminosarum]